MNYTELIKYSQNPKSNKMIQTNKYLCFLLKIENNMKVVLYNDQKFLTEDIPLQMMKEYGFDFEERSKVKEAFNTQDTCVMIAQGRKLVITEALAPTIELHENLYKLQAKARRQESLAQGNKVLLEKMKQLYKQESGTYKCTISFIVNSRKRQITMSVLANSGHDAYILCCNAVKESYGDGVNIKLPLEHSKYFSFDLENANNNITNE